MVVGGTLGEQEEECIHVVYSWLYSSLHITNMMGARFFLIDFGSTLSGGGGLIQEFQALGEGQQEGQSR